MTTRALGEDLGQDHLRDRDGLGELFDSSPARPVHTSAAAETAFLSGTVAALAAPFSLMLAVSLGLAAIGLVTSVVGLARASRRAVAGSLLASVGLVLSLAALALLGVRYLGIDTAFADGAVPTLVDWLTALNQLLPSPGEQA
jgi:hypothetical protein